MKKIFALLLSFTMLLCLAACGNTPSQPENSSAQSGNASPDNSVQQEDHHGEIYAIPRQFCPQPYFSYAAQQGNIEVEEIELYTDEEHNKGGSFIRISGLKDKTVQDSINREIKNTFDSLNLNPELPPYTGIVLKTAPFTEDQCTYDTVYTDYCCQDNILSVVLRHNRSFNSNPDGSLSWDESQYFDYSEIKTLNFDLSTGKQILLEDLLCDDVDALAYFDGKILDLLLRDDAESEQYNWLAPYDVRLTAPYQGIYFDQSFFLNSYDSTVQIIFGPENPEFFCESYPPQIEVDIADAAGYQKKFAAEDLYEDPAKRYVLKYHPFDPSLTGSESEYIEQYEGANIHVYVNYEWSEDVPEPLRSLAKRNPLEDDDVLPGYLETYRSITADSPENDVFFGYADYSSYLGRYSDYPYLTEYRDWSVSRESDYEQLYYRDYSAYSCYDASGHQLSLEDVFVPTADIRTLIVDAWFDVAVKYYYDIFDRYSEDELRAYLSAAFDDISGFYLGHDSIYFSLEDLEEHVIAEMFPYETDTWSLVSLCSYADYAVLGCENLTIF